MEIEALVPDAERIRLFALVIILLLLSTQNALMKLNTLVTHRIKIYILVTLSQATVLVNQNSRKSKYNYKQKLHGIFTVTRQLPNFSPHTAHRPYPIEKRLRICLCAAPETFSFVFCAAKLN